MHLRKCFILATNFSKIFQGEGCMKLYLDKALIVKDDCNKSIGKVYAYWYKDL